MKKLTAVVFTICSAGVGCAAEQGDASDTADELLGTSRQALTNDQQSQLDAGKILAALLARDLHGIPSTTNCSALRNYLSTLEATGDFETYPPANLGVTTIRGLPAIVYELSRGLFMNNSLIAADLQNHAATCFPSDINIREFVAVSGYVLRLDPGPATLTASLGSSTGASAAAIADSVPTTAWKWPKTMTYRPAFVGGEASEYKAQVQSAGFVTSCNIKKSGSYAASLCPAGY